MSQTTQATKQHTAPIRQQSSSVERCASFVVCQQIASIALVVESATPDPSALHPFCSGAALHNGCTAPQRVQRHTALQRHSTQSSTNHHTRQDKSSSTHNGYRPHNSHNTSSNTPDPSALHPFCSGVAPHNGCIASGSSPAYQSTRNGDNAEVLLMHVGNRRGQPQQRSRASHRSADGHHSCLSTSSTGERSQGHRTTHGCTSTHSLHRMAAVNGATTGTNMPVERSVASLGSVTSRLAGRPHEPRPSHPTLSQCGHRPGLTAPGPHPCSARTRPTTFAEAGAPDRRDHRATTSETSMDGSTSSAVDRASASTPDEATTLTCRTPA